MSNVGWARTSRIPWIPELSSGHGARRRRLRMRTAKKGGRGVSWAGRENGAAQAVVAPSPPEPAPAPAVTRYQSSPPRRSAKGGLWRGFGWFLLAVLVIGA